MRFSNSKKQGDAGLGSAIAFFTSKGITVCIPLTDSQDFDLVIDDEGLKKIQVKTTTYQKNGTFIVAMRTSGGNRSGTGKVKKFDKSKADFIFVLTSNEERYLIPSKEVTSPNHVFLGKQFERFKV